MPPLTKFRPTLLDAGSSSLRAFFPFFPPGEHAGRVVARDGHLLFAVLPDWHSQTRYFGVIWPVLILLLAVVRNSFCSPCGPTPDRD